VGRVQEGEAVVPIAAALDLGAVPRDRPFDPGRLWLQQGDRCEMHEVDQ
jgi:hypothetical protein